MNKMLENIEKLIVDDEAFAYFLNLYMDAIKSLEYMCIYSLRELQQMRDKEAKKEKIEKVLSKVRLNNQEYSFEPVKFDIMLFVARRMGLECFTKNEFEDIDFDIIKRWYEKFFKVNVERYLNTKNFWAIKNLHTMRK